MKLQFKLKSKEAKAIAELMEVIAATEELGEEYSTELHRLNKEIGDQLGAGKKVVCIESDLNGFTEDEFKKLVALDDFNISIGNIMSELDIDELEEVTSEIVKFASASDSHEKSEEGVENKERNKPNEPVKINPKPIFPVSDREVRYGVLTTMRDRKEYSIVVTIGHNGNVTGWVDSIIEGPSGGQKRDEYIDRSDKWFADQLNYWIEHENDPHARRHIKEVMNTKEIAIHTIRGNVFKTRKEYIDFVYKYEAEQ